MKIIIILLMIYSANVHPQNYFNNTYDLTGNSETGYGIVENEDGSIVVAGPYIDTEISDIRIVQGIVLMKLNQRGELIWSQKYADSTAYLFPGFKSFIQTSDGGYAYGGGYRKVAIGQEEYPKYLIAKFDSLGNKEWFKTYGGEGWDTGIQVKQTWDEGFIMVGRSSSFGDPESDIYLVRTDKNGEVLWERTYGEELDDYANTVEVLEDRGFIIGASIGKMHNGTPRDDSYIFKTDSLGNIEWDKKYNFGADNANCIVGAVKPTLDGGYLIKSCKGDWVEGELESTAYIAKIDERGGMIWRWEVEPNNEERGFQSVGLGKDTTYAFAGWFRLPNDYYKGWMGKLDKNGQLMWENEYIASPHDDQNIYDMVVSSNGDMIATGQAFNPEDVNNDEKWNIWVFRVNCKGEFEALAEGESCETVVGIEEELPLQQNSLHIFPNPTQNQVQFAWNTPATQLSIYNITGQLIAKVPLDLGQKNLQWEVGDWRSGVYLVVLEDEKEGVLGREKMVVR